MFSLAAFNALGEEGRAAHSWSCRACAANSHACRLTGSSSLILPNFAPLNAQHMNAQPGQPNKSMGGQGESPQAMPQRPPSPASQEVATLTSARPVIARLPGQFAPSGAQRPPLMPSARPLLAPLRLPSPFSGPSPRDFRSETGTNSGHSSAGAGRYDYWSAFMPPQDLPPRTLIRLVPGLVDPEETRHVICLERTGGTKRLGDMSMGTNRAGAKRFREQYTRWVEPLFDAFERVHGMTPKEAWQRRHEAEESEARKRLKLQLLKAKAEGAQEAQRQMQAEQQNTAVLATYGNRQSLSRYSNQRLALYYEVNLPSTALRMILSEI